MRCMALVYIWNCCVFKIERIKYLKIKALDGNWFLRLKLWS